MNCKAIIFDFDGVLNDTEGIKFRVWQKIAAQFGKKISKGHFIKNCCGKSGEATSRILIEKYRIPLKTKEFANLMHETSRVLLAKNVRPIKSNIGLLKKSYRLFNGNVAVASSQCRDILVYSLKKLRIMKFIKEIVAADDVKRMKPAPDIYARACKKLKVKAKQCIVIEDSQAGVESAYNARIGKIIAIPGALTKYQDFSKADATITGSKTLKRLLKLLYS